MRFNIITGFEIKELMDWVKAHLTLKSLVIYDGQSYFNRVKQVIVFHLDIVTDGSTDYVEYPDFKSVKAMFIRMQILYSVINYAKDIYLVILEVFTLSSIDASIKIEYANGLFKQHGYFKLQ